MAKRNISGLKRGGPGRPKGAKNKSTSEMEEFFRAFFDSEPYRTNVQTRVLEGKASHIESFWHAKINGKPPEHMRLTGADDGPVLVKFVDAGA